MRALGGCLKWGAIVFGILIGLVFLGAFVSAINGGTTSDSARPTTQVVASVPTTQAGSNTAVTPQVAQAVAPAPNIKVQPAEKQVKIEDWPLVLTDPDKFRASSVKQG